MEVNDAMIDKLAGLSRLKFNAEERESIKSDLKNMINLIQKMDEVDTENVEPLLHMSANVNVMREDVVQGSISNAEALQNAGNTEAPYFIVPKVIKK